jgi:hypothetical protein
MQGDVQAQGRGCDARGRDDLGPAALVFREKKSGVRIGFRECGACLKRWRGRTGLQRWAELGGGASWAELGSGGLPGGFLLSYFSLLLQTSLKLFEFKFDFEFKPHSIN